MIDVGVIPAVPPANLRFRRRIGLLASTVSVWQAREVVLSLAERDLRARYKQAVLGFAWSLAQPLSLVLVFTVFFRHVARIDTHGVPYPLFAFIGLLPWGFFSAAVTQGGMSLLTNNALLNKVYCPREVFPLAGLAVAAVDTLVSGVALAALFVANGFLPRGASYWVPVLLAVQLLFTVAVTLLLSVVVVYVRDLRHVLPIALQFGLFATPVAYDLSAVPGHWRPLYAALNPLAPVIDGYRHAVLYGTAPDWSLLGLAATSSVLLLLVAMRVFSRLETGIADLL